MFRKASALALVLALAAADAADVPPQSPAAKAPAAASRLAAVRGPIKITAENAELEQRATALYRGNVRLVSPDIELTGDRLELKQPAKGQFEARLTGKPARLRHQGEGDVPPVRASANEIVYDTRTGMVDMMGAVQLERGTDVVMSETVRYDMAARRISASGVGNGQVQIVIHPPDGVRPQLPKPQNTDTQPAAQPPSE